MLDDNQRAADHRAREIRAVFPSFAIAYPKLSPARISNVHRIMYQSHAAFRRHCTCAALGYRGGGVV